MEQKKHYEEKDFKKDYGELRFDVLIEVRNIKPIENEKNVAILIKENFTREQLLKFVKDLPIDPMELKEI